MKKYIVFLGLISTLVSCQDDFCVDETTPNFIIRFYDKDSTVDVSKNINLIVNVADLDSLFEGTSIDSIYLPVDTTDTIVTYNFSILDSLNSEETLTINYEVEDVYVSKACGFKSIFNNVSLTVSQNNWIDSIVQVQSEIINDTQAHVKIYH